MAPRFSIAERQAGNSDTRLFFLPVDRLCQKEAQTRFTLLLLLVSREANVRSLVGLGFRTNGRQAALRVPLLSQYCLRRRVLVFGVLLKSAEEVTLTVATTSQLPSSVVVAQTYSWVTPDGRPTSPPPEYNPRLHHHQVSRVEVEVVGSESLGLMIRGGVEYGLGIFITGVDEESAAHKAGLQVGDQILEVNKESFLAVTHDTAVNVLKYSRRLRLALRRVGKVPHSCTTYDRRCWPSQTK
ncbi:putative whirlin [Penaeus vannamei]|uniref:Putative whirlin n=1 Tax=Penaeus vannamei TaxID=6689 RepID=A0A3R7Q6W6_PENVA|nr:putative whirlin [Penaeus vannamei]